MNKSFNLWNQRLLSTGPSGLSTLGAAPTILYPQWEYTSLQQASETFLTPVITQVLKTSVYQNGVQSAEVSTFIDNCLDRRPMLPVPGCVRMFSVVNLTFTRPVFPPDARLTWIWHTCALGHALQKVHHGMQRRLTRFSAILNFVKTYLSHYRSNAPRSQKIMLIYHCFEKIWANELLMLMNGGRGLIWQDS